MDNNTSISKVTRIKDRLILGIDSYVADPRLSPEEQLRKRWALIWMLSTLLGVIASIIYFLFILNLWPLIWVGVMFIMGYTFLFLLYPRVLRFDLVCNIIFAIFTLMVFFAMLQTGGLSSSLGFVFVGINAAMGSVLVGNLRWTIAMFTLYCSTIVALGIAQPYLQTPDYITAEINAKAFVFLAVWINACILFLVILFMKDKSRYEKAEAEKLRKLDEAKTLLYTNVSHEFRTPLTIIRGIAEQIEDRSENQSKSDSIKIKTQSEILLRLVKQMLDISKIEAEGIRLNEVHGNIGRYIQYITAQFESLAQTFKIHLSIKLPNDPIFTDYDPEKLMEVLANLLSNAIKFTQAGGNILVTVSLFENDENQQVQIRVSDTGKGIPAEEIPHIFDRFYQVKDHKSQTSGTGLGLALTYELVELMNGKIKVDSTPGKGSVFSVNLPIKNSAPKASDDGISSIKDLENSTILRSHRTSTEKFQNYQPEKPLLLIVEDNEDVLEYLVSVLESNYQLDLALNGKEGLEKARNHIPDVILTDVMMPEMDGFEMIGNLRNDVRTDHIPVVVLTARGDFDSQISGLEIGADHYLVKPFNKQELLLKLRNLLEARNKMQLKIGILQPGSSGKSEYRQEIKFMGKLNTLLETNLDDENFGVTEICMAFNMSRPQLYRKFKALTNESIGKYLRSYRLQKAKYFLESKELNVTEAAFATGFKNLSHFSAIFHEEFGIPPSEVTKDIE
ncbi:ATP-binding protein [Maribellus sediminis]|uniref:hybrid sensor histidine kinase/response regulator transcription factor n=1 Tax=Maribellus sediminis TaxID=2696285 RepID=UPI001431BDC7|nr:ATP-binding protein [Maribellus sediminis]